jgi:hypothetical protein
VEEVEQNPWGDGCKIATGKIRRDIPPSTTETWDAVRKLFPQGRPPVWTSPREEEAPAFTAEELQAAAKRLRPKKAPGPDGISPEVVKNLVEEVPEVFLEVMNDCLRIRTFPRTWKVARLILLSKGKPGTEKRKFRPICLLDTLGKLLEHLIRARLANNLEEKGGLSDAQFGFREGLSTVNAFEEVMKVARFANAGTWGRKDYCALVLIDVENAFNSAPWARVVEAMERRTLDAYLIGLIQSYLTERGLVVTNRERVQVVCGVPQGSVLGPVLWNIMYDGVLRVEVPVGVRLVAFADDLAIVGTARTEESLVDCVDRALSMVAEWMKRTGLRLANQKTEAVLLVGRRRPRKVKFTEMAFNQPSIRGRRLARSMLALRGHHLRNSTAVLSMGQPLANHRAYSCLQQNAGSGKKPGTHQHERKVHSILYEKALPEAELMEKISRIDGR